MRNEVIRDFVVQVNADPEAILSSMGIGVTHRTLDQTPSEHQYFSKEYWTEIYGALFFQQSLDAREHDADVTTLVMRQRHGNEDRDIFRSRFVVATRNGLVAQLTKRKCIDLGAMSPSMTPPIVHRDAEIAKRLDAIAFPGMTANFDAAKTAALALTMLDWREFGQACATEMIAASQALARALEAEGVPVFAGAKGFTNSHQFAVLAEPFGGGQAASKKLRQNGFLACGIGLPVAMVDGDMNGLRIGTPELVRRGMTTADMAPLAALIARALRGEPVGDEVASWRRGFKKLCFVH